MPRKRKTRSQPTTQANRMPRLRPTRLYDPNMMVRVSITPCSIGSPYPILKKEGMVSEA